MADAISDGHSNKENLIIENKQEQAPLLQRKRKRKEAKLPSPSSVTADDSVEQEINDFYNWFPSIRQEYEILTKIGEGTFSTVYKAKDLNYFKYDNKDWIGIATFSNERNPYERRKKQLVFKEQQYPYVAIKRIYHTSSPERMLNEIEILKDLSGNDHVVSLITAERHEDQLVCVLPYFEHEDFRDYFHMMSLDEIQDYLRELFKALSYIHSKHIMHRDVKPSNFLYSTAKRRGVLADFGLAQREEKPAPIRKKRLDPRIEVQLLAARGRPGFLLNDSRPIAKANRAGTRGFRAPEVLFKVAHQTTAIDIWSVGVLMLSLFTGLFPFFQSNDDGEALIEIGNLFGKKALQEFAANINRTFDTNIPEIGQEQGLRKLCHNIRYASASKISNEGYDLLEKCLTLDPNQRITADKALVHPFLGGGDSAISALV